MSTRRFVAAKPRRLVSHREEPTQGDQADIGRTATEDEAHRASTEAQKHRRRRGAAAALPITGLGACSPPVSWSTVTLVRIHSLRNAF